MKVHGRIPRPGRSPHVAVVVPCHNYGRYLDQCITSIVTQEGVTVSATIIDDASTDDSADVAEQIAARHPQVSVTRHHVNAGHIATYNEGLAQVDSDYVTLLSADDMLAPGALARATRLMEAMPEVGLVYGHPSVFEHDPQVRSPRAVTWTTWDGPEWVRAQFRRGLGIIYSPEAVVRTRVQHEVGYYDASQPHAGDLDMWLRIARHASVGRVNGADQAYRRVHAAAMSQTTYAGVPTDLDERAKAYRAAIANADERQAERLSAILAKRMGEEAVTWAATRLAAGDLEPDDAVLARMLDLAGRIDPDRSARSAWREFELLRRPGPVGVPTKVESWARAQTRDLQERVRWRRWRYLGV